MAEQKSRKSEIPLAGGFDELQAVLDAAPRVTVPASRGELIDLALHGEDRFEVSYDVPGRGEYVEAVVNRCRNGASVNYSEPYMRRRDPNCMVIADDEPTDKPSYADRFGGDFMPLRDETLEWLKQQNLIVLPFMAGGSTYGYPSVLVVPENAGFFAAGLADLQGFLAPDELPGDFKVRAALIVAPPFRHTHFSGEQVVVHNRTSNRHEIYSYNLYPGPSAKKGIYGVLLTIGEEEGWTTLHGSTVKVITPYDNIVTIMHEGASGGGKSEMIERMHKELDGQIVVGENLVTGESIQMTLSDSCSLRPVTDDMALCHPKLAESIGDNNYRSGKLIVTDAEAGWFLRVNHIDRYGTDPFYERLSIHPPEPLIFLNLDASPGATCLIWEHTMDSPGVPCPNPRVIMPRAFVEDIENDPVRVDVRSFGIRVPPCTKEKPSYGIVGLFHILPPSLAWLWRLVAPRGHANPSITHGEGLSSEGVGSFWPFATGKMVDQANLLLTQIEKTPATRYKLIPNQHIGAYKVSFMPQWIAREYLARRGSAKFRPEQLVNARCSLLGTIPAALKVDGNDIPRGLLQVNHQPEVGTEAYDAGADELYDFFRRELPKFLTNQLRTLGQRIIECCLDGGSVEDYDSFIRGN